MASVTRVSVSVDGRWSDATLGPQAGPAAWRAWSFRWDATAGEHELCCRATDGAGNVKPLEAPWNYQGMGNNGVQRLVVTIPDLVAGGGRVVPTGAGCRT